MVRGACAMLAAVALAACAGASSPAKTPPPPAPSVAKPPAPPPVARTAGQESFQDIFDRTCVTCHAATTPPMPDFTEAMSPDLMALALNRLTAREMPPPGFKGLEDLTDDDRERLVHGLCLKTGRSNDVCTAMAAANVRRDLMRPGSVLAEFFAQKGAPEPLRELLSAPDGNVPAPFSLRRPASVALVFMAALRSCQPEPPASPNDHEDAHPRAEKPKQPRPKTPEERARCVENLLQTGIERPAPLP